MLKFSRNSVLQEIKESKLLKKKCFIIILVFLQGQVFLTNIPHEEQKINKNLKPLNESKTIEELNSTKEIDNTSTFAPKSDNRNENSKPESKIILAKTFSLQHLNSVMDKSSSCNSNRSIPYLQSFVTIFFRGIY